MHEPIWSIKMLNGQHRWHYWRLVRWRMIYGLGMYFAFLYLCISIHELIMTRGILSLISCICFIVVIVVAYWYIVYHINVGIDRWGNIPLILADFRYEKENNKK